jgi:hypothetical protein
MADLENLVLILGPGDEGAAAETLVDGLRDLADGAVSGAINGGCEEYRDSAGEPAGGRVQFAAGNDRGHSGCPVRPKGVMGGAGLWNRLDLYNLPLPRQLLTPRQAFFAPRCQVPLTEAAGKVAAEAITPYPPGVPLICPGEVIDEPILECLDAWRLAGGVWPGMAAGTIDVVDGS